MPGSPLYEEARQVGRLLVQSGCTVVNGGYGGVMEGASRGAREAGGEAVGVTTSFAGRGSSNPYLSVEHQEKDLFLRTRRLIELSRAFIILPGKSGTLSELTFLWALNRGGLLPTTRIVLLGDFWEKLLAPFTELGIYESGQRQITRLSRNPEKAVEIITSFFK
jgi:uncharacterized protein (TIGR00730 family)